tara:strand:+ start:180 stop:293 length:114 start_codon:yes stop_codon:yes gene_type:complete
METYHKTKAPGPIGGGERELDPLYLSLKLVQLLALRK